MLILVLPLPPHTLFIMYTTYPHTSNSFKDPGPSTRRSSKRHSLPNLTPPLALRHSADPLFPSKSNGESQSNIFSQFKHSLMKPRKQKHVSFSKTIEIVPIPSTHLDEPEYRPTRERRPPRSTVVSSDTIGTRNTIQSPVYSQARTVHPRSRSRPHPHPHQAPTAHPVRQRRHSLSTPSPTYGGATPTPLYYSTRTHSIYTRPRTHSQNTSISSSSTVYSKPLKHDLRCSCTYCRQWELSLVSQWITVYLNESLFPKQHYRDMKML